MDKGRTMVKPDYPLWNIDRSNVDFENCTYAETNDGKYLIVLDNVVEYGIMRMVSHAQIWTDKSSPKSLLVSSPTWFEYHLGHRDFYTYLPNCDIIVLMANCKKVFNGNSYHQLVYVLLDFSNWQFSLLSCPGFDIYESAMGPTLNLYTDFYNSKEEKERLPFYIGKGIQLDKLNWYKLKDIVNLCSLAYNSLDEIIVTT